MRKAFPCNNCGACCRSVELMPQTAGLNRGDGTCRHYNDTQGRCGIYAQRPDVCNVEKTFDELFQSRMTWPIYVALNLQACTTLSARLEDQLQGRAIALPHARQE
ncbi:YkgJ family cysteine cluster protein [Massilia sp. H6]|uniref:YkgJ family cysteine cluster protein n=1 Tax=Massilia sp. H6 TaxID=2970464 RepID=UPI002167E87F|nr:YkgJ family cysteine cluster protein [Massilia sp. H6]UVW30693.1 YkgJ family cysteine cluster protein [Massilia sp. H6]